MEDSNQATLEKTPSIFNKSPSNKTEKPRVCPKCKNPYWDKPRKRDLR